MHSPSPLIRPLLILAALAALVVAASGCGTTNADTNRGRVLFIQKCGICHTMAQAGTTAQIGPDLDDAFASAREIGQNGDTVEGIVSAQIESPRPVNGNPAISMPPDIVSGQDLDDVSAYVAQYAGVPGAAPPTVPGGPGAQVFANNGCGGCHTLAAAKSGGVTGPNLDEVLPGHERGDGPRVDRRPQQRRRLGLPAERDAPGLRAGSDRERTRTTSSGTCSKKPPAANLRPPAPSPKAELGAAAGRCDDPLTMRQRLRDRLEISPGRYAQVTAVALAALALIVLTGAAVRLTGSGLGCPDWPKCYGGTTPPLESHAVIEYGNRLLTGFVGFAVIAASVLAFFRRPYRWHLALFGALLPLGVVGQAILGALVVKYHLAPGLVMSHFILSMMLLDAAFALAWCSRYEPWERRRSSDRLGVWSVRALIPLGQLTILAGTIATASGPHAGAHEGQLVHRFTFEGAKTLEWVVQRHATLATVYGLAAIAVWFLLRRPGGDRRAVKPLAVVLGLLALQGAIGGLQWALELPSEMVWVHVAIATLNWLAMLWTVAAAGRLEPSGQPLGASGRGAEGRASAPAGAL